MVRAVRTTKIIDRISKFSSKIRDACYGIIVDILQHQNTIFAFHFISTYFIVYNFFLYFRFCQFSSTNHKCNPSPFVCDPLCLFICHTVYNEHCVPYISMFCHIDHGFALPKIWMLNNILQDIPFRISNFEIGKMTSISTKLNNVLVKERWTGYKPHFF